MSSLSPEHSGSQPGQSSPEESGRGGLSSLNVNFLKSLTDKRAPRADGSQPKRRGPKPDSKPALTRRQELNRQAQRTHRERKELYIKALEEEVLRLKDVYSTASQEKAKVAEENKRLRALLMHHGIPPPADVSFDDGFDDGDGDGPNDRSNASVSGSQSVFSPGTTSQSTAPSGSPSGPSGPSGGSHPASGQFLRSMTQHASVTKGVDYDQAGIEFVLTLERPCMSHLPQMMELSEKYDTWPCGHALMATCPPKPVSCLPSTTAFAPVTEKSRERPSNGNGDGTLDKSSAQGTWDIPRADLATLMDLSGSINLDGEVTPIMAWAMVVSHPRFLDLEVSALRALAEDLGRKVRCYGFGAVTEEFEVRDAIEDLLSSHQPRAVTVG